MMTCIFDLIIDSLKGVNYNEFESVAISEDIEEIV